MNVSCIRPLAFLLFYGASSCTSSTSAQRPPVLAPRAQAAAPVAGTGAPRPPVEPYTLASVPGPADCTMYPELVDNGIALVFSGRSPSPDAVRERVRKLASQFDGAHAPGNPFDASAAQTFGLRRMIAQGPIATTADTPSGARLVLSARAGTDLAALRASVIWHAADLLPGLLGNSVECPVLPGLEQARARRAAPASTQ